MSNSLAGDKPQFGKLRSALWPIHASELKKFIPLALMMLLILFIYATLRSLKDSLVVPTLGAEAIPFLKFFVVLPSAILFFFIYTKLVNIMKREHIFYLIVGFFITFFVLFGFVFYPLKDVVHPDASTIARWMEILPANFHGFLLLVKAWSFSVFYVLAEMWGVLMISLMFWQFANQITRTKEAKRFYAFFGIIAQLSLIMSGSMTKIVVNSEYLRNLNVDPYLYPLYATIIGITIAGGLIGFTYFWMNRYVLTDPKYYDEAEQSNKPKKKKAKLSIADSMKYLFSSKYLGYIAILVVAYGLTMGLIEIVWKNMLRIEYPSREAYLGFMSDFQIWFGVFSLICAFSFKGIVRRFGWFTGAMVTPIMMLVTFIIFFVFVFFKDSSALTSTLAYVGATPIFAAVIIGAVQNILSKGTKYSLFDPTKEMAYIPLDEELKVKGKAAVDVVGNRFGKGSSGLIGSGLMIILAGNIAMITPYVAAIVGVFIIAWLFAVKGLNKLYHNLVHEEADAEPV